MNTCPATGELCGGLHCEPPIWCERQFNERHQWRGGATPQEKAAILNAPKTMTAYVEPSSFFGRCSLEEFHHWWGPNIRRIIVQQIPTDCRCMHISRHGHQGDCVVRVDDPTPPCPHCADKTPGAKCRARDYGRADLCIRDKERLLTTANPSMMHVIDDGSTYDLVRRVSLGELIVVGLFWGIIGIAISVGILYVATHYFGLHPR